MASVTLGQHPGQHHLDSDKLLFRKLANGGKKLMRKPSREKMTRERAAAAPLTVPSNPRGPSDPISKTTLTMCDSSDTEPPRSTDGTSDADRVPAAQCAQGCACNDAAQAQTHSLADAPNANANNNGIFRSQPRRSSAKYLNQVSPSSGCKTRVKIRSLSADADADALEGIQLERLTQGRGGVVKLMRTGQPRRQAWSIFDQDEPKNEKGEGHLFSPCRVKQDWCDACSRQIRSTARRCECKLIQE